jgi:hypothetical protein
VRGSLNELLSEPVGDEVESVVDELLRRKLKIVASLSVRLLRAMEARFGPEVRQVLNDVVASFPAETRPEAGDPETDLRLFCAQVDQSCAGTHRWERVVDEPTRVAYRFTRCIWADVFRELGEPDLGAAMCASDEPAVKSFNPGLALRRTKVIMQGDEFCDHVFFVPGGEKTETS